MEYVNHYASPLGPILLASDGTFLTGLWFEGQKHVPKALAEHTAKAELPVFSDTKRWLDLYFSGRQPDFCPSLSPAGTPFQQEVWALLRTIPWGQTMSYGQIAAILASRRGISHFSAQAVGSAVGRNPISILIPCHRVIGARGQLTGYAGGLDKKSFLLALEQQTK